MGFVNEKRDFFISYCVADKSWAIWVAAVLENAGYSVFVQAWDIKPGDDFINKIERYLSNTEYFVLILSKNYFKSHYCMSELESALNRYSQIDGNERYLFPVRIDDVIPDGLLASIVYLDLYGIGDEEQAKKRLLQGVDRSSIPRRATTFPGINKLSKPQLIQYPGEFPINNLQARNPYFVGRSELLEKINEQFHIREVICLTQVITGLGGIGKTQMALEYAHRYGAKYNDAIWWINSESAQSTFHDCLRFADALGLLPEGKETAEELSVNELGSRLKSWQNSHRSWLLVFDNAYDSEIITPYISSMAQGHVLVTSRNHNLHKMGSFNSLFIEAFSKDDAIAFMHERLSKKQIGEKHTLEELIEQLGRLPLALAQAASYIVTTNINCKSYLLLLNEHGLKVFDTAISNVTTADNKRIVSTTWEVSFKKLSEPAQQLLNLCAYMAPDNIPFDIFVQERDILPEPICSELSNSLTANNIILDLTKCSFTKRNGNLLSIHRLIQEIGRQKLLGDGLWISCCLSIVHSAFSYEYGNRKSMDAFALNVPHILEVAQHAEDILRGDKEAQKKVGNLYYKAGQGFYYNGQYEEALNWYCKSLGITETVLGKEHLSTATIYDCIADVYVELDDFNKALEWYQKALEIREKTIGNEHPDTATSYNNIAVIYESLGDYSKALEWTEKSLTIKVAVLGNEHPDTAASYTNIAAVYNSQGDYPKALEWYQKALAIYEKVMGAMHPSTSTIYNNIANLYLHQGDIAEALEWYQKALSVNEKVLGIEHPNTATIYNNIAQVYSQQGDSVQAFAWYLKALSIREKTLGEEHPDTAITYQNIGAVYFQQKKYTEALSYLLKASLILEKKFGINHPSSQKVRKILEDIFTILLPAASLSEQEYIAEMLVKLKERISVIQNALKFDWQKQGATVCHYTKLSTLPHLLKVKSEGSDSPRLRLSNMGHLNDPTEGQYLFELLDKYSGDVNRHAFRELFGSQRKTTEVNRTELPLSNVYIGSLSKAVDKLPMWTLYGDDSKGCCLVFSKDYFIKQTLYRVHYVKKNDVDNSDCEIDVGKGEIVAIRQIAQLLDPYIDKIANNNIMRYEVLRILDSIRFLFKSEDYEYEDEVRLILHSDDQNSLPQVDRSGDGIPRLFLNVEGDILYDEIILGAKVTNPSTAVPFIRNANVPKVSASAIEYR